MENKAGNTRRYESYSTDYFNKENRYDYILHIWLSNLICRRYKVALMHFEINVAACSSTIKTALISGFGMIYDYLFVKNKYYSWWCVWILPNWKKKGEGRQNFTVCLFASILCLVTIRAPVNAFECFLINLGNKMKKNGEKYLSENWFHTFFGKDKINLMKSYNKYE